MPGVKDSCRLLYIGWRGVVHRRAHERAKNANMVRFLSSVTAWGLRPSGDVFTAVPLPQALRDKLLFGGILTIAILTDKISTKIYFLKLEGINGNFIDTVSCGLRVCG